MSLNVPVTSASDVDLITPLEIARIMKSVFNDTAHQIAQGLKAAYTELKAYDIGVMLLDKEVYPALTREQMQQALSETGLSQPDIAEAVATLYPKDVPKEIPERSISMLRGKVKLTLAVSDEPVTWSFPVICEMQNFPAMYASVFIDKISYDLYPGKQTVQGTGKVVSLSWANQKNNSVKIGSNPFNMPSEDGYTLKDVILSDTEAMLDVMSTASPVQWDLDAIIQFAPDTTATVQLMVNRKSGTLLKPGNNQLQFTTSLVSFSIRGYQGSGPVSISYKLKQR